MNHLKWSWGFGFDHLFKQWCYLSAVSFWPCFLIAVPIIYLLKVPDASAGGVSFLPIVISFFALALWILLFIIQLWRSDEKLWDKLWISPSMVIIFPILLIPFMFFAMGGFVLGFIFLFLKTKKEL